MRSQTTEREALDRPQACEGSEYRPPMSSRIDYYRYRDKVVEGAQEAS